MTLNAWNTLKRGDLVKFGPRRTIRKILHATRVDGRVIAIRLMKLHESWTPWTFTVYCKNDRSQFSRR